jgi:hypothetical protein
VNLRDTTFEAHRDEPPLDAFINSINFYIQAPRFSRVIQRRLELVLEKLPSELAKQQHFVLESGSRITYPSSKLGEFLLGIYLSLFEQRTLHVGAALEALVAKDVRRALGMFADIIVSPHIPTNQITGAALAAGPGRIQEARIIRALMRGRHRFYNGRSAYIRNVIDTDLTLARPSNLLHADILEYLIKHRKTRIDFSQEGYALPQTIIKKMGQLGYDEEDTFKSLAKLVSWGLVEPESLIIEDLSPDDAVRVHASGFTHMRFFISRAEYLVGVTPDMSFASHDVAEDIGRIWMSQTQLSSDLSMASRRKVMDLLTGYLRSEYERRCRRHAFYAEMGSGGRTLIKYSQQASEFLSQNRPAR